jgi:hypothetical protein
VLGEGALDGKDDGSELDVETVGSETDGDELKEKSNSLSFS